MTTTLEPPTERANGLATYFSIIATPRAAFAQLSRTPMWGWAAICGIVMTAIAVFVMLPEQMHLAHVMQQRQLAQMPADQRAAASAAMASPMVAAITNVAFAFGAFVGPWIAWLIYAIVFLVAAALAGGTARFGLAWVAGVNSYVIGGIGYLVTAVLLMMRGTENVNSPTDVFVIPSLAMLVHGSAKLAAFLYGFNVFYLWSYVIGVIALEQVMKIGRTAAIITMIIVALIGSSLSMLSVR